MISAVSVVASARGCTQSYAAAMRKALMLIPAVAVAVIAIAAVVRVSGDASKSPVATRDAHTTAGEASGSGLIGHGAEQPVAAAMPSREVERQQAATAQVAASSTAQQKPTTIASPSRETGGEGDASSPTDEDDAATPKTSKSALTEEVNELFFVEDYCNVTSGGDENLKQRCRRAGALAEQIVSVPRPQRTPGPTAWSLSSTAI